MDGKKMRITRNPSQRIRQAVRDNNVPVLSRLQHHTDLRNTDKNRLTSLSWAVIEGSLEVFEWLLLDYGHDDQELSRDTDNNTILHLLASIPSPPTLSPHIHLLRASPLFPPRISTKSLSEQISTCLRMTNLYYTLFPFLLDWSNSGGKTALHVAAQAGNTAFISLLCDYGADVDLTDLQGNTPLHYAAAWGHVETIRVLLERGAGYANRNYEGFTASDFAYSHTVMNALQSIARELFEERRSKRRFENGERGGQGQGQGPGQGQVGGGLGAANGHGIEGRLRSGSVSTSLSTGSGSAVGSNVGSAVSSHPTPSSGSGSVPRSTGMTTTVSSSTSAGRPVTSRSPSVPVSSSNSYHSPTPPLPPEPTFGSFAMRRANSAQTGSNQGVNGRNGMRI